MDIERIHSLLGSRNTFVKRPDGWWLDDDGLDVRIAAAVMLGEGARLVTMTAVPVPGPGAGADCRIIYHWDIGGKMVNIAVATRGGRTHSIAAPPNPRKVENTTAPINGPTAAPALPPSVKTDTALARR